MYVTSKLGNQCREGKPKCIGKAGVDDVDVRTALVGFSKEMVGIGSTDGIGMEMFTERKEEALTKQLARLFGTASEAVDNPCSTGTERAAEGYQFVPSFDAMDN